MSVNFVGGFAWIFLEDGTADVGLIAAPTGSAYQHRMLLTVDAKVVDSQTTHPSEPGFSSKDAVYHLVGDVVLTLDGQAPRPNPLQRKASPTLPSDPDDFFHIYSIGRLRSSAPPRVRADYRQRLVSRLPLSDGRLKVSGMNRQPCVFIDGNGQPVAERRELATIISYQCRLAATSHVEFRTAAGNIRLKATEDLSVRIEADCLCGSEVVVVGQPLPGFDDVFELYSQLDPRDRVTPLKSRILAAPVAVTGVHEDSGPGLVTPGPDCPPTEHS